MIMLGAMAAAGIAFWVVAPLILGAAASGADGAPVCPNCGPRAERDARFCSNCGAATTS